LIIVEVRLYGTGFAGKTLWDWLQLLGILAIPLILGSATLIFSVQQAQSSQEQQRADILQKYIDNIQDLILNHNLLGNNPTPKSDADKITITEVQEIARARTLTALQGLDSNRKGVLVQFLYEAQLISQQNPTISLNGASLDDAYLFGYDLTNANLSRANLYDANLQLALLLGANLDSIGLYNANLSNASLEYANLSNAFLYGTNLTGANLQRADLRDAYLSGADLRDAKLSSANFSNANLSDVHDLTQQQFDQVYTCKGAILPTGLTCHKNP
jgi:uncharacterized protein YjbI with pentapeptide repeats